MAQEEVLALVLVGLGLGLDRVAVYLVSYVFS